MNLLDICTNCLSFRKRISTLRKWKKIFLYEVITLYLRSLVLIPILFLNHCMNVSKITCFVYLLNKNVDCIIIYHFYAKILFP